MTSERCRPVVLRGISPAFARLSPCCGQVVHAVLTLTPLYKPYRSTVFSCDLHALTTPPTFVLSQDQTLHLKRFDLSERILSNAIRVSCLYGRSSGPPQPGSVRNSFQAPSRPAHARLHLATYSHVKVLRGEEGTTLTTATPPQPELRFGNRAPSRKQRAALCGQRTDNQPATGLRSTQRAQ